jgi:hypothetical protein
VVALDTNVLINLSEYGAIALDNEVLPDSLAANQVLAGDLTALADLIHLWFLRDIRFITTPRILTDFGQKVGQKAELVEQRIAWAHSLLRSLSFQVESEGGLPRSDSPQLERRSVESPPDADGTLVREAAEFGAHVFLTSDRRLVRRWTDHEDLVLRTPTALVRELVAAGVGAPWLGGTCAEPDCPYADVDIPAPDLGKWAGLLSILLNAPS